MLLDDGYESWPVPNLQAAPATISIVTKDVTPPAFDDGYPRVTGVHGTGLTLGVSLSEPGAVYWVAVQCGQASHTR